MADFYNAMENHCFLKSPSQCVKAVHTLACLCAILPKIQPYREVKNREWGKSAGPVLHTQAVAIWKLLSPLSLKMLDKSTALSFSGSV